MWRNIQGFDVRLMIRGGVLKSELKYERAKVANRSLKILEKEDPSHTHLSPQLCKLIQAYEVLHWPNAESVTDARVKENDLAELQVEREFQFLQKRKELILDRLTALGLKQQDLALLLNHSKSYSSELINGLRPLSSQDLILIHRPLSIKLEDLFMAFLPLKIQERVRSSMRKLASKNVAIKGKGLKLVKIQG